MDIQGAVRGLWVTLLLLLVSGLSEEQTPPKVLFPPGRPSLANLQNICNNLALRPSYQLSTFPANFYAYLRRQATAVNSLESLYKGCCKNCGSEEAAVTLKCVQGAWESALMSFCDEEFSVKTKVYSCCETPTSPKIRLNPEIAVF
ncbi:hypothetical protein GJAV_G00102860 [Gymnothorax javanicus]|nr:hypothetical protein GJAV_G00102860 [Gymnothorax javanicus]